MRRTSLVLCALCTGLAACAGAPTRIHTLEAQSGPTTSRGDYSGPPFRVDAVHIPPAFDRPELIRRTEPFTLTLSDTDRWAAPIGELIRRALTQDLSARLPAGIVIFPDAPKPATARGLVVDILSITPTAGGVEMEVSWTWIAARGAGPAVGAPSAAASSVMAPSTAHLSTAGAGAGPTAVAQEISTLLALLADRIASAGRS